MSYKTILVHAEPSRHLAARVKLAANIALTENAHLIAAAMTGISQYADQSTSLQGTASILKAHFNFLHERAMKALEEFEAIVKQLGVPSYERRLVDDEVGAGLSLQARYCDLVVIGQIDRNEPSPSVMTGFPEYVVMNCGRPVLIMPYAGQFDQVGKRVLVAWNATMEATRAVTSALPLLKRAQQVRVAVLNPEKEVQGHGQEPGADIALYLARHGVQVEVAEGTTDIDVGNALLSMAADMSSDLLVMGCYGHSRFRELMLGGATRTLLESMTIPVLMAH